MLPCSLLILSYYKAGHLCRRFLQRYNVLPLQSSESKQIQQVHAAVVFSPTYRTLSLADSTCSGFLTAAVKNKKVKWGGRREWKPERLIEYINHFLDRGYVVSLLMDLCHCFVNHSTHSQTRYYLEAKILCRQIELEDIILLLSILFSSFPHIFLWRDFGFTQNSKTSSI